MHDLTGGMLCETCSANRKEAIAFWSKNKKSDLSIIIGVCFNFQASQYTNHAKTKLHLHLVGLKSDDQSKTGVIAKDPATQLPPGQLTIAGALERVD